MKRLCAALLALVLIALSVGLPMVAFAAPIAVAKDGQTAITLYNEPCRLTVVDLPSRATWVEAGVVDEGCFGTHPEYPIVVLYFDDRSIVILLKNVFTPLSGA